MLIKIIHEDVCGFFVEREFDNVAVAIAWGDLMLVDYPNSSYKVKNVSGKPLYNPNFQKKIFALAS